MEEEKVLSLKEFCDEFGTGAIQLDEKYIWTNFGNKYMVVRYPLASFETPSKEEFNKIVEQINPIVISYIVPVDEHNKENTYLYISHDQEYVLEKLKGPQRRTTKKALRTFEFRLISWQEFDEKGYKCYKDARERNGLADGDYETFKKLIEVNSKIHSYKILAAISPESEKVAAALIFNHIDRLITTTMHYSDNDFLIDRPNNGLFHILKEMYLVSKQVDTIEYGYSSMQKSSNFENLHFFKVSIGFDAVPVCRKFVISPKYKIYFNPITQLACKMALKVLPRHKYLLKLNGLFSIMKEE